ncbi:hypothetical protein [Bradyrhizobium sp. 6(2017)]|uniref:hypothetical protein n=1 Tax=Bradyrhizobium sp. 6(2017) TaxID=1197460 RepID=UPI0013E14263|nr:hypothetical protein [Bradyrhizobium sp. 6(2017)]QIG96579.1 hypothetical protein G6P99_32035 [Bradyrhizobium sp. 6(2017)]
MSAEIIEMSTREAARQWERDEVARAIQENKILNKESDRKKVALRLARLLHDAAADERGSKTRIVHLAWPTEGVPLKKLDRVTLPLDGEPNADRLKRLAKKPKHYAQLAKAIAHFLGLRSQDVLVDIFRGTQIEAGVTARSSRFSENHSEDWDKLAELIAAMATAVATRKGLREYLRCIGDRSGTYSLETETIRPSGSSLLPHGPLAHGYEVWDNFPPIPSVPIFVKLLAGPYEREIKVVGPNGGNRVIPVTVTIGREVRLAIGPADERETPRPMFEIRTVTDMLDRDGWNWAGRRKWFYLEGMERFTTQDKDGNELVAEIELGSASGVEGKWIPLFEEGDQTVPLQSQLDEVEQAQLALSKMDARGARQWEHVYATWLPVTSISCAELLGGRPSEGRYALQVDLGERRGGTFLPHDSVGSWVEAAILTNGERPIEMALEANAERLAELVRGHIIHQRGEAEANHRRALAEWANESEHRGRSDD